jgi:deazaflavin-dependent oxidoreductase (nitroreductase family)
MSDANDFNERNIAEFRANHGRVGGQFDGAPLVILHTVGARSGKPRTNIMMCLADGDRYLVFASKAGADENPAWYWNLKANPRRPHQSRRRRRRRACHRAARRRTGREVRPAGPAASGIR